jgi:hypothetical protein
MQLKFERTLTLSKRQELALHKVFVKGWNPEKLLIHASIRALTATWRYLVDTTL